MTLRAVLFDFDMTLADTSSALLANVNRIAGRFGLPLRTREQVMEVIGCDSRGFWRALLGEERPEYREYYFAECAPHEAALMAPAEGAAGCLAELRAMGVKVGCASNRTEPRRVVRAVGLERLMDCVVGAGCGTRPKPAPDMLLEGAGRLGCTPEDVLYVGDAPADAEAASRAGMKGVAVLSSSAPETLERAGAWRIIGGLGELIPLLKHEGLL